MNNRFLKNIIFLLFVNLLIKPFWILGIDRAVQVSVGDKAYGLYLAIFNFSYLFYIVLDAGMTNFNSRNIAQNNHLLAKHFVGISQAKMFLSLAYFIIIFLIGWIIGYDAEQMRLLALVGFNQMLLSFILYVRSNISALLLFKTDSIMSVFDRVLMIIVCGFMLWSGVLPEGSFTIYTFIYTQMVSYAVTLIIAIIIVVRHSGRLTFKLNIPFIVMIVKKSLPYALLVLLMSFYSRLEPVLIERILPKDIAATQTGVYAKAYRLFDAGNNISYLFSVILLPLFAAIIKSGEGLKQLVKQSTSIMLSMTCIIAIVGVFFSKEIMELLYGMQEGENPIEYQQRLAESSRILQILMGSFVSISVIYIFGTLLTANGNLKHLNIVSGGGVVVNIALNFLFIPRYQAVGAALTSCCVQFIICAIQFFIARKIFNLSLGKLYWIKLVVFILAAATSTYLLKSHIANTFVAIVASLTVSVLISFITRVLHIKELFGLVHSSMERLKK